MASSLQAITLLVVALLPGAFYVWGFERNAGRYGIGLKDRALRLIGASSVFIAVFAWALYWLYATYWQAFKAGESLPAWLVVLPIGYLAIPGVLGWFVGSRLRNGSKWARTLAGFSRAPRAWDHLFQDRDAGWVRCRMKSNSWIGGVYAEIDGKKPYASGYPEVQELYLTRSIYVNQDDGSFVYDSDDRPLLGAGGVLIRWDEIEFIEFIHAHEENHGEEINASGD